MSGAAQQARARVSAAQAGGWLLALLVAPALGAIGAASDYAVHAELGAALARGDASPLPIPAPLFAWSVALVCALLPAARPRDAALAIGLASHLATYALLLRFLRRAPRATAIPRAATRARRDGGIPEAAIALALVLAAPIPVGTADDHNYYFGYIGLATYHNPTIALLRPFALALFAAAAAGLEAPRAAAGAGWLRAAAIAALAALAKPSFSVALLPALAVAVWLQRRDAQAPRAAYLACAIGIPSALALGFEYAQSFGAGQAAGLRIAPLAAFRHGSQGSAPLQILLSAAFPLAAALCAPRQVLRERELRLAWLCALFGLAIALLFEETGARAGHGNFLWSAQISLFVLFAASARWLFRSTAPDLGRRRRALVAGLLALHAICGLLWLGIHWLPLLDAGARPLRDWF